MEPTRRGQYDQGKGEGNRAQGGEHSVRIPAVGMQRECEDKHTHILHGLTDNPADGLGECMILLCVDLAHDFRGRCGKEARVL